MYEDETREAVNVDERLLVMQQYVDMDLKMKKLERERELLGNQMKELSAALRDVTQRLGAILGFGDSVQQAKRSLEAEMLRR